MNTHEDNSRISYKISHVYNEMSCPVPSVNLHLKTSVKFPH